jgi:chromosome segregation ATPase
MNNLGLSEEMIMNAQFRLIRLLALMLAGALICGPAFASPDKKASREKEAARRAQMQLQQVQSQLSALEQEKLTLGSERDKAQKEAKGAKGKIGKLEKDLSQEKLKAEQLLKDLEGVKQELATTQTRLAETETKLTDTGKTLAQTQMTLARTEADKRQLESIKTRNEREIASCEDKNLKLYQTGRELMTRFEKKSCGEVLAQKEPFTGLKRVEIENLLEEYRDKLDDQKLIKAPGG